MRRLLVEELLVDPVEATGRSRPVYDETLGYSLAPDGRPYVEVTAAAETRTVSEVSSEDDDSDEEANRTSTFTFVQDEAEDWEDRLGMITETAIKAEDPDRSAWAATTTFTKIEAEAEDRD